MKLNALRSVVSTGFVPSSWTSAKKRPKWSAPLRSASCRGARQATCLRVVKFGPRWPPVGVCSGFLFQMAFSAFFARLPTAGHWQEVFHHFGEAPNTNRESVFAANLRRPGRFLRVCARLVTAESFATLLFAALLLRLMRSRRSPPRAFSTTMTTSARGSLRPLGPASR